MQAPVAEHEFALSPRNSPARSKGWTLIRTRGGHNVWKSPDGSQTLAIPRHDTVTKGVVRQVMKSQPGAPKSWN